MDIDLERAYRLIMDAARPEQLFGGTDIVLPPTTLCAHLETEVGRYRQIVEPSNYQNPEDLDAAREAQERLRVLVEEAERRIRAGTFALPALPQGFASVPSSRRLNIGGREYLIGPRIGEGRSTVRYRAYLSDQLGILGEVMIKVARDLPDSRAVRRELSILQLLHESEVPQWKHLPFVIDRFDAGGRIGAVLRSFPGPTLAAVRELPRYRSGVDQKHVMWIVDRLLSCLGYVHRLGVVHGTIDPSHVLIEPDTHNVCLTGWSFGVIAPARSGERILVPPGVFSAPEVQSGAIGPWTDIYSVGKLMIWLAGGAPGSTHVPTAVAEPIRELLRSMVEEDSSLRPHDAWALAEQFAQIKQQLWQGRFFPFQV